MIGTIGGICQIMYDKFFLISLPRSGSSILAYLLNLHPRLKCLEDELTLEIFNFNNFRCGGDITRYLENQRVENIPIGAKCIYTHTNWPYVKSFILNDSNTLGIIIERNPLEVFISLSIVNATSDPLKWNKDAKLFDIKINFDPSAYELFLEKVYMKWIDEKYEFIKNGALRITYNQISNLSAQKIIYEKLGVDEIEFHPPPNFSRRTSPLMSEKIKNYGEMFDYFKKANQLYLITNSSN
jgi:hypothetical protein